MSKKLLLFTYLLFMLQNTLAATTLIYAGELLTVPGEKTLQAQTITVVDGKITAVTVPKCQT